MRALGCLPGFIRAESESFFLCTDRNSVLSFSSIGRAGVFVHFTLLFLFIFFFRSVDNALDDSGFSLSGHLHFV